MQVNILFAIGVALASIGVTVLLVKKAVDDGRAETTGQISVVLSALANMTSTKPPDTLIRDITKLSLKPGDVLVFRIDGNMANEERRMVKDYVRSILPDGVGFLLLNGNNVDITVLSPDQ